MEINSLIEATRDNKIRITDHAFEEAQADSLSFDEIFSSIISGEIIEDYPKDKPFPCALVLGFNFKNEPIHSVWGYNPENGWAVLITVYRPDPNRWINWKIRRK